MIKKYISAFVSLFAITLFLVTALTVLAQVQHPRQDKERRSAAAVTEAEESPRGAGRDHSGFPDEEHQTGGQTGGTTGKEQSEILARRK